MEPHKRAACESGAPEVGNVSMRAFGFFAAVSLLAIASSANAYTAYLSPQTFAPEGRLSAEAAYATAFFTPAMPLSSSEFHVITPEDSRLPFDSVRVAQPTTTLDLATITSGTYLLTTGEMLGPVTPMVGVDGGWRPLAQGEAAPEGAPTTTLQTVALADTYVSRGRPSENALDNAHGALAIQPVTHPNRIAQADGFIVQLNFNGAPFPNMPIVLYAEGEPETKLDRAFVTGADGRATLTFDRPGKYVAVIRHRGPAPAGSAAQIRSYTSSLTFEVHAALPALPPEDPRPRRRR
jgi:hypothetical protein